MRIIGKNLEATRETSVVASGTIESGISVVVNSDGTVSAVSETNISEAVGTGVSFDSTLPGENCVVYDSNAQKVVITYRDTVDSNKGHAVVGTVTPSNNSISFGTPVQFTTRNIEFSSATYDSANNKVVVAYADSQGSRYGYAIVGDVSGTSISFGSETVFNSYEVQEVAIGYDANAEKVVIVYEDWGNSNVGTAIVGTVSGTSISFGTEVTFDSNRSREMNVTYDSNAQKIVIAYKHDSDNSGEAIVGTVSGTSISFGSSTGFDSNNVNNIFATYDSSAQKVVIAYRDVTNNSYGEAIVGTVSGTSISFGTSTVFNSGISTFISATYDANVGKVVIAYRDNSNSLYGTVVSGTVSGTSISFDTELVFDAISTSHTGAAYDSNSKKVVIASSDTSGSGDGVGTVYQASGSSQNLTAENFVGMARGRTNSVSSVVGSETIFEDAATRYPATAYDTLNNKIVIAYEDDANSDYGTAIVGTVSGNTISFGTPVVFESANTDQQAIVFDENAGKVLITYRDNSDAKGYGIVGTVSGTSISFGTATQFESTNNPVSMDMSYDPDQQKCLVVWRANGASDVGRAKVATISGTSVSFGSVTTFFNGPIFSPKVAYDTNENKHVVCFVDDQNTDRGLAIIGTVSGTSVTFGSTVVFDSTITSNNVIAYDSSVQKVVIAYTDESNSNEGTAVVGTVSGNSISFGDPIVFTDPGNFQDSSITYDSGAEKIVISFRNADNSSKGTVISGKVAGNSITFDTEEIFNSGGTTDFISSAFDPDEGRVVIAYQDSPNGDRGTCVVYRVGYVSRETVATDGNALIIDTQGAINTAQASLTAGQSYYVQTDGTITTTAGDPSVFAGTAVSSTKLIVKG